ncbi:MAG: hypothetical protein L6R36_003485 [Xanthoria steineri]|nr:MAG: hypothetical protein L6R36_003485 [Xanthoria steineri]
MHSPLYLLIAVAGLLCQAAIIIAQENLATSGNYQIEYCGKGPGSKAARLQALLPQFRDNLQLVLADVKRGTKSKAYRAYFKSQANAAYVESIFQAMADGTPLQVAVPGAPSDFRRPAFPTIVCVDPSIPIYEKLRAVCSEKTLGVRVLGSIVPQTHIMVVCPAFWQVLTKGPVRSDCPTVKRNKFVPDNHRVAENQYGVLVHEFTHAYTHNWDPKEVYDPMEAVKLNATRSLKNPSNFALYAASIVAGCPQYVNPNILPDEERILQEIPGGNTTDIEP